MLRLTFFSFSVYLLVKLVALKVWHQTFAVHFLILKVFLVMYTREGIKKFFLIFCTILLQDELYYNTSFANVHSALGTLLDTAYIMTTRDGSKHLENK